MARSANDYYPTPDALAKAMVSLVNIRKEDEALEPCRGEAQAIYKYLPENSQYAELSEGIDYLNTKFYSDVIITNPPFSIAMEFVQKGLKEIGSAGTAMYLLRLNWLGSIKRHEFLRNNPPTHVYVLCPRPSFTGGGTDSTEYALVCWDFGSRLVDKPGIHFLKWK